MLNVSRDANRRGAWRQRPDLGVLSVLLVLAFVLVPIGEAGAQTPATASTVVDSLDRLRSRATPLWRAGDHRGLALLDTIEVFLSERHVQDLRRGSLMLQTRVFNFRFEVACARATVGDTAGAVRGLKALYEAGGGPQWPDVIERACPPLYALRSDSLYKHVLALWRSEDRRWGRTALATPYRDTLPVAERVAGLSLTWSSVKHLLPGFETAPGLDLDSLYVSYLPLVQRQQSTLEYYRLLRRFVATLRDAHTTVILPESLAPRVYARPPVITLPVNGSAVVRWVLSPQLEGTGIAPGQIVTAIDGIPTEEYVNERVAPYVSASTPHDRALRSYGYELLAGDSDDPVELDLLRPDGSRLEVEVPRSGTGPTVEWRRNDFQILEGNVGYLRLDDFGDPDAVTFIEEAMGQLVATDGLVVDVRRNGGGSSAPGYRLLTILADSAFMANPSWIRVPDPNARRSGLTPLAVPLTQRQYDRHPSIRYSRPVVVLTGPMTFSAAEDFVASFVGLDRGTTVGQATGGSTGQPVSTPLPGGGAIRVRSKHDTFVDGREFIGQGIRPDIVIGPTIDDIAAGRDPVLARALRVLRDRGR